MYNLSSHDDTSMVVGNESHLNTTSLYTHYHSDLDFQVSRIMDNS